MVRKKRIKKKTKKTKKTNIKSKKKSKPFKSDKRRFSIALKNFILFAIFFVLCFVLYNVSTAEIYVNLFLLLSIVLGFVSLAFLIAILTFLFMRFFRN